MYGKSIISIAIEVLKHFDIKNAKLLIEDFGALPFVIAARLEATIKQIIKTDKDFLPPMLKQNNYETQKDKFRFSRLYLPGNNPSLMINAGFINLMELSHLEDAVAVDKKFEARFIVRNALRALDLYGAERMVRINQVPKGLDDLVSCAT